jgi:hypothetical protein
MTREAKALQWQPIRPAWCGYASQVSDAPAVAADVIAISALALSGFAVIRGEMREHRDKRRRRATGPAEDLREAIISIRTLFAEIASMGGQPFSFFIADTAKR